MDGNSPNNIYAQLKNCVSSYPQENKLSRLRKPQSRQSKDDR